MVTHHKTAKLSSQAKTVFDRMELIPLEKLAEFYSTNQEALQERAHRELSLSNPEFLEDFVNLRDDRWDWFRKKWHVVREDPQSAIRLKAELRSIWGQGAPDYANSMLTYWLYGGPPADPSAVKMFHWIPDVRTGRLVPVKEHMRGRLALAVLENYSRLKKCINPHCPAPFFLAKRKTQCCCDVGECTKYAQNQRSLEWWEKNKVSQLKKRKEARKAQGGKNGTRKTR
jgi:hypothetical protein